ncbi:MAG TPA: hypothetical protein VEC56_09055 [Candidatus Krumholzibacteria bacterium]|nr:hypothetical protein [Candidatus Krumholzibacteria bacterium]
MMARVSGWVPAAVALAVLLGAVPTPRAESIFGMNLLGERLDAVDARTAALGGFVQTIDDSLGILQYNPAMLAWAKRVTFSASGYLTRDANQSPDLERTVVASKFSALGLAFPLFRKTLTASVGYRGRYDPDGDFSVPGETPAGETYNDIFARSGGTWSVPITMAADLGRFMKVGGTFSLERGTIENRWLIDFAGTTTADASSEQIREVRGTGFAGGVVVRPIASVSVGVAYEAEIDYDVNVKESFTNASADTSYEETMRQPERWTASASWRVMRGFTVYAGGSLCDFTNFEGLDFPSERLTEERVASFGLEYRFRGSRFPIRASARFEQLPYTMPDGEEISRVAFTLGSGLIFRTGRGKLDAALTFAQVGSVDTNTYEDQQVRFFISIAGSESWATKREGRY